MALACDLICFAVLDAWHAWTAAYCSLRIFYILVLHTRIAIANLQFAYLLHTRITYSYAIAKKIFMRVPSASLQYVRLLVVSLQIMVTFSKLYYISSACHSFMRGGRAVLC